MVDPHPSRNEDLSIDVRSNLEKEGWPPTVSRTTLTADHCTSQALHPPYQEKSRRRLSARPPVQTGSLTLWAGSTSRGRHQPGATSSPSCNACHSAS